MVTEPLHNTHQLTGHDAVEEMLLKQINQQNLPHAMLFCGPKGVGKATMAYRLAKFLAVGAPPEDTGMDSLFGDPEPSAHAGLDVDLNHPAIGRIANGSHGDIMAITPQWDDRKKAYKNDILVDDVRKVGHFLAHTPSECAYRIVIIDSADALNVSAANALLKLLEEPPQNALMLLISHRPGGLLPTIRSRCRNLSFTPPSREAFNMILQREDELIGEQQREALYSLAEGSPGFALSLAASNIIDVYREQLEIALAPKQESIQRFSGTVTGKKDPQNWKLFQHCWFALLSRTMLSQHGALEDHIIPEEGSKLGELATRLSPDSWMQLWEDSTRLFSRTDAVYLDPKLTVQHLFGALSGQAIRI